jgi:nitrogen fixation NifU-like protein
MLEFSSLYQEIILDHYRNPRTRGCGSPSMSRFGMSAVCGDEVTMRVRLAGDRIEDVSYDSEGCSISQASESVLTELVIGRTVGEAMKAAEVFGELMASRGSSSPTRTSSATRSLSPGCRSTRHASSVRSSAGWPGRTPQHRRSQAPARDTAPAPQATARAGSRRLSHDRGRHARVRRRRHRGVRDVAELGINVVDLGLVSRHHDLVRTTWPPST